MLYAVCPIKKVNNDALIDFLNDTGNRKGMSPCCMEQLAVSLVFSLKFIYLNLNRSLPESSPVLDEPQV